MTDNDKFFTATQYYNMGEIVNCGMNGINGLCEYVNNINFTNLYHLSIGLYEPGIIKDELSRFDVFNTYVAKEILSADQICAKFKKCTHNVSKYKTGAPAILTNMHTAPRHGFGKLFRKSPMIVADIHLLEKDDIVVDHNLNQIWPVNTGQMPTQLQKLLQQSNGR